MMTAEHFDFTGFSQNIHAQVETVCQLVDQHLFPRRYMKVNFDSVYVIGAAGYWLELWRQRRVGQERRRIQRVIDALEALRQQHLGSNAA